MNITEEIGAEISEEAVKFLKITPEIQVYANHNIQEYQWRDGRKEETCDTWKNPSYKTRSCMKEALEKYLIDNGYV
jgi:hypothetical protein